MKKILFTLFTIIILSSCSTYQFYQNTEYVDYTFFKEKGIFVTEAISVNFNYESLGSISIVERSGYTKGEEVKKSFVDPHDTNVYYAKGKMRDASLQSIYNTTLKEIQKVGGNGILNFKISYLPAINEKGLIPKGSGMMITGMVIKRSN